MAIDISLKESFLEELLTAIGPSGYETEAAHIWMREAETFTDAVDRDTHGNSFATINPGGSPRLLLAGHVDEIGVIVSHIDNEGFIYLKGLGGWDPQVLVGQRIRFRGTSGPITGVIGNTPIHVKEADERGKAPKISDLWADIGAADGDEAKEYLDVGSVGVIEQPVVKLLGSRIVSRALDNRIGAFVVLEALRHMQDAGVEAEVTAVATVQEEIGSYGARTSAFRIDPDAAIVVDTTFCTAQPGVDNKEYGDVPLGSGVNLTAGPLAHPAILAKMREIADEHEIPHTLTAYTRYTGTDADAIVISREGIPAGILSIPSRYLHSPSEMVELTDVEATIELMVRYAQTPLHDLTR